MVNLRFLLFSDGFVRQPETSPPWIFNPFMTLRLPNIPSAYTLSVVFGIDGLNPLEKHKLQISVIEDRTGNSIDLAEAETDRMVQTVLDQKHRMLTRDDNTADFIGNIELRNYLFKEEGYHTFKVRVDGKDLGGSKLYVMKMR